MKLEIVKEFAAEKEKGVKYPLKVVSERHNIPFQSLSRWVNDPLLTNLVTPSRKRKKSKGRPLKSPAASTVVMETATELREQKLPVSGSNLALLLKSDLQEEFGELPLAKARRIVYRILKQNDWTVRRVTNNQIMLDEQQLGDEKIAFVQSFNDRMSQLHVSDDLIINMDETPGNWPCLILVYYDPEVSKTFEKKGTKKISVKKSKTTARASALLAVSLSGEKLKPLMVFIAKAKEGKVKKETNQYDQRMVYGVSEKGFSDTAIMLEWVKFCLKPYVVAHGGGPVSGKLAVVTMDNFKAHLTKPTRDAMSAIGVIFFQLPANCTSVVQILDVGVNKPFKGYYEFQRDQWMMQYIQDNGALSIPAVSRKLCAEWSSNAWEQVKEETILNTASKIGFISLTR